MTVEQRMSRDTALPALILTRMERSSEESSSSDEDNEEISYGPGFVSRLKSRYMCQTQQQDSREERLRRTTSLENFVEKDKDEQSIELRQTANPVDNSKSSNNSNETKNSKYVKNESNRRIGRPPSRPLRRTPVMARAQSVEVLQHEEQQKLPTKPLQVKERASTASGAETFLKHQLAKDEMNVIEKNTSTSTSNAAVTSGNGIGVMNGTGGVRGISGIADRELPAPDIVKETRKIFELRSGGKAIGPFHQHRALPLFIQAKATNNLSGPSIRTRTFSNNNNNNNNNTTVIGTEPLVATSNGKSVSSSNGSVSTSVNSAVSSKPLVAAKPSLPTKPSHLGRTTLSKAGSDTSDGSFVIPPLRRVAERGNRSDNSNKAGPKALAAGVEGRNNNRMNQSGSLERQVGVIRPMVHEQVREQERNERNVVEHNDDDAKVLKEVLFIEPQLLPPKIKAWVDSNERRVKTSKIDPSNNSGRNGTVNSNAVSNNNRINTNISNNKSNVISNNNVSNNKVSNNNVSNNNTRNNNNPNNNNFAERNGSREDNRMITAAVPDGNNVLKENKKDVPDAEYREKWKRRNEAEQHTMVFNFVNSKKAVSHIENDGRDIASRSHTKRKKKQQQLLKDSGIVLLQDRAPPAREEEDDDTDSDIDVHRPVPPCTMTFIGANAHTGGKSSMRSKSKGKKLSITFSASLTQIHEYHASADAMASSNSTPNLKQLEQDQVDSESPRLKTNSFLNGQGGLGSYTPSHVHVDASQLQLGLGRKSGSTNSKSKLSEENVGQAIDTSVASWSSNSSDILF